jgi:hypothetical protein
MEVAQCQQAPHERAQLAAYAVQYGLDASQGLIFISPARGSNWAANFGYPLAWKGSGAVGSGRRTKLRGKYEPVFLYPSGKPAGAVD